MYQYETSYVLPVLGSSAWLSPNLRSQSFSTIYGTYALSYIALSHPALTGIKYLDLNANRRSLSVFPGTVQEWLDSLGNKSLPLIDEIPKLGSKHAVYSDATRSGFQVALAKEGFFHSPGQDRSVYEDASLNRSETNMNYLEDHCLFTVNGYIHDCSANDYTLFVRKAAISAERAGCYNIGIISFAHIGKIKKIKLTPENITPFETGTTLAEKIRITVPEYTNGKSYFLVMGGYLIFPEQGKFKQVDNNSFYLDLNRLDILEKFLESSNFIDLRSLDVEKPNNMRYEGWKVEDLMQDETLRKYLTLSQSFFVEVDTTTLSVEREDIHNEPYTNRFLRVIKPTQVLMGGYGRIIEYWPIQSKIGWILDTQDNMRRLYAISTIYDKPVMIDSTPDITNVDRLSAGYLLDIKSF